MTASNSKMLDSDVRTHIMRQAAATGRVPQDAKISAVCGDCGEPMTLELKPDWRRFIPAETRSVFASVGLTGNFWKI